MGRWSSLPRATRWVVRVVRPPLMVLTRRDWRGVENFPSGGFVVAANHLSHLDPFVLSHFMVDNGVVPRFLTKDPLFRVKVIGSILRGAEMIPVYRSTSSAVDSLTAAVEAVREGKVVTIYPEGTITRDPDAWPMSGRTGAVRVALETGAPLVPVAQWGAQEILWPYSNRLRLLPRKTIHVRVGEPFDLSDLQGREATEQEIAAATDRLMDTLTAMVADIRGELPTRPRIDVHTLGTPRTSHDETEQT